MTIGSVATLQYGPGVGVEEGGDPHHRTLETTHEGQHPGFLSLLSHCPQGGPDIVILSNQRAVLDGLDDKTRQLVLGTPDPQDASGVPRCRPDRDRGEDRERARSGARDVPVSLG